MDPRQYGRQLLYEAHLLAAKQFSEAASTLTDLKKKNDRPTQEYLQPFIDSALASSENNLKLAEETKIVTLIRPV